MLKGWKMPKSRRICEEYRKNITVKEGRLKQESAMETKTEEHPGVDLDRGRGKHVQMRKTCYNVSILNFTIFNRILYQVWTIIDLMAMILVLIYTLTNIYIC